MRKKFLLAASLVAVIIVAVIWIGIHRYQNPPSKIEWLFGGSENAAIVGRLDRVEAYRIGDLPAGISEEQAAISDYPVLEGPMPLSPELAASASDALLSPSTYGWDFAKACIPAYGVRLSFFQGADRVDVLLCFECNMLLVARDGVVVRGEDFDYSRPALVRTARAAFPMDEVIQSLKEQD